MREPEEWLLSLRLRKRALLVPALLVQQAELGTCSGLGGPMSFVSCVGTR